MPVKKLIRKVTANKEEDEAGHTNNDSPSTLSSDALNERIDRAFFGLDAKTLDLLEGALDADEAEDEDGEADGDGEADAHEDFNDVLCSLAENGGGDASNAAAGTAMGDASNVAAGTAMSAPSPSAEFGMADGSGMGAPSTSSSTSLYRKGATSTMWEGLGVEDGGMGLREVSKGAEEGGYDAFLEEVELIREVFRENGEVELIREKRPIAKASAASQPDAGDSSSVDNSTLGRVVAIRVQVMPPHVLNAFNAKAAAARGPRPSNVAKASKGAKPKGVTTAPQSKGLFVVATYVNGYPDRAPLISIEPWHNMLPTNAVTELNKRVVEIIVNSIGAPVLMATLMMIAQEAEQLIESFQEGDIREISATVRNVGIKTRLTSEAMHPDKYLGSNLADILAKMPPHIAVQCVENVMRTDLALNFEKMQRYLFAKNVKPFLKMKNIRNQTHILEQAEAVPSFHGTRMDTVGYIVKDGLLVPGQDTGIAVRCGSRFGNGIYSSPDPNFAAMYAERQGNNFKLILCATLLGKRCIDESCEDLDGRFDSRVADHGVQYVVFHRAQILPCYVLHVKVYDPVTMQQVFPDLKNTLKAEMKGIDADASEGFFGAQEIQKRRREVMTRMALKNLPFGFGPKGIHFVVEAIAEVSDDDEALNVGRLNGDAMDNLSEEMYQHETLLMNRLGTNNKHPTIQY